MKFIEKASGWLIAIGLAIAVLFAFNYLDVLILTCFRSAGVDTKIYRGVFSATAGLVNAAAFGLAFLIFKKQGRSILDIKKTGIADILLVMLIAVGMLGFVHTFISGADTIGERLKPVSDQMTQYRDSMDRYKGIKEGTVPLWDSLLYLFSLTFIVPFEEELIFRGAIFGLLKRKMSPVAAVLISAVIFGVMHKVSVHTAYALICGMILCVCYYYTENIFATTIMHSLFNFFGSALPDLLKLKQLGIASATRLAIVRRVNIVCITLMVPAALALLLLRYRAQKRRNVKPESVAAVE